jgi:hypothetical protein
LIENSNPLKDGGYQAVLSELRSLIGVASGQEGRAGM